MNELGESKCCGGHTEQLVELKSILEKYKDQKGVLIPVLQETQNVYGYLSKEALRCISKELDIPLSQIYGVVTFYSQFHLNQRGRNVIKICQGTACHVRGGKTILESLEDCLKIKAGQTTEDLRYTLEIVACIGACGLAPVMMINDETYGRLTPEIIPEILSKYE